MSRKINVPEDRSRAWWTLALSLVIIAVAVACCLAGCKGDNQVPPPCPPAQGCLVPSTLADATGDAAPVPWCEDLDMGVGPCSMLDDAPDGRLHWYYEPAGRLYPEDRVDLGPWCLVPDPCPADGEHR